MSSFSRAADLAPSDPRPHNFLGEMYGVVPDLAHEITVRLARFVKAQPDNALAHYYYAMSLWKGEPGQPVDLQQVEALLRRAVTLEPAFAKGFLDLGILLTEQQRDEEAIEQFRQAAQLEPTFAQAHYRLAHAYRRTGQQELAAKELKIFEQLKARTKANRE